MTIVAMRSQAQCRSKCLEDLQSTTRYVTWSLHTKSRSSLKQMLSKARTDTNNPCPRLCCSCVAADHGTASGSAHVHAL